MFLVRPKNFSWDFYSKAIIAVFVLFQLMRWSMLPQYMDIYYHLHTAEGFLKAGGYSTWDFWQYAPVGRPHIYPPFFHIILALLMKIRLSPMFLARFFEVLTPVAFLIVLWNFIRKSFDNRLAFFVLLASFSLFSFCLSLSNNIPAALALIFGIIAFDQFFRKGAWRALIFFTLMFYTHIGVSWFFIFTLGFYGLFNSHARQKCLGLLSASIILAAPILIREFNLLINNPAIGFGLNEKYFSKIKVIDYLFAAYGLILIVKIKGRYRIFVSLLAASLVFLIYPYRFFPAEGFLPVILLVGVAFTHLFDKFKLAKKRIKIISALVLIYFVFLSPTVSVNKDEAGGKLNFNLNLYDSAFYNILFARGTSPWFPEEYSSASSIIEENSQEDEIIYSTINPVGVILGSISQRPTANALLPEIGPATQFDPLLNAKIVIFAQDDRPGLINYAIEHYKLKKLGENKLFILYINPAKLESAKVSKAALPFWVIILIGLGVILLLWKSRKLSKKYLT